jgi:hypothetical protein
LDRLKQYVLRRSLNATMVARTRLGAVLAGVAILFGLLSACVSTLQDRAAFKKAEVFPPKIRAGIGDVIDFQVRPPVREGTRWMLETYPPVRFAREGDRQFYDWVANGRPIQLQAIIGPWDVRMRGAESGRRSWLWFAANDEADPEPYEEALPIQRLPYREIAPVTASSAFDVGAREPRLAASYSEKADRVYVVYKTPVEKGTPALPGVYPMLVESQGKKILYTEVWVDFGQFPFERVGYRVTLSYAGSIRGPVEVVVVEWTGHGESAGPFDVHRMTISGLSGSSDAKPKPAAPPGSATPPVGSGAPPAGSSAPPAAGSAAPPASSGGPPPAASSK